MPRGSFEWLELITGDVAAAESFYCDLLGWTIEADPTSVDPYDIAVADGVTICGFDTRDGSDDPPHWLPYINATGSFEETLAAAEANGGTILRQVEIPGDCRFATIRDPDGALCCALEEFVEHPPRPASWPPANGSVSWYAHASSTAPDSARFYVAVFGYDADESERGNTPDAYPVLKTGEELHAGLLSHGGRIPTVWLAYFVVPDIEAAQHRVVELGGRITTPIMNIPGIGRVVSAADPHGALFCLHQVED